MGSVYVSSFRCCVFVSVVHPIAILSVVLCVICSMFMSVSDASGDHGGNVHLYGSFYRFVCDENCFFLFPPCY